MPVDEGEMASMPDEAANVAGIYAVKCDDVRAGTGQAPGFGHAARMVEDLLAAARDGTRVAAKGWPEG